MELLNKMGITGEQLEAATGEVGREFKPLDAGVYKATVKEILIYVNNFGGTEARYTVNLTTEDRDVTFLKDVGQLLKDGTPNGGYANRLKQFLYATGVDQADCNVKENFVEINSFGKKVMADAIIGMNGKPVMAEVLLMDDTTKEEGEAYKLRNVLAGVLAMDGTDASGENMALVFDEKAKTTPITKYQSRKAKAGNAATQAAVNPDVAAEADASNF